MSTGSRNTFDFGMTEAQAHRPTRPTAADEAVENARSTRTATADEAVRVAEAPGFQVPGILSDERRFVRVRTVVIVAVLAVLVLVSLCITDSDPLVISPIELFQIYGLAVQQLWLSWFDPAQALTATELMDLHGTYYWTLTNAVVTFAYFMCGCMLALSGALYQNVFRNPIASPSMLGVSSGVQLGIAVLVLVFSTMAGAMLLERYLVSFVSVAVILAVLFGLAKLMSGKGRPMNVTNLLVVGVILNQFVGVIITYITWFCFDEEEYDVYMGLTSLAQVYNDPLVWGMLIFSFAIAVVPIVLMRFRMNALSFSPAEMRMFGVNSQRLQLMALVFGTIIMVTAQLQVGTVAMITLVVPHLARGIYGAEFRKQMLGTMLLGAAVLVACHAIAVLFPYTGEIPVGVVVNLVLLPAFVWVIAVQQRRWE